MRQRWEDANGAAFQRGLVLGSLTCPLTRDVFTDPVVLLETGHTYERAAILQWLQRSASCPLTRRPLRTREVQPALLARSLLSDLGLPLASIQEVKRHVLPMLPTLMLLEHQQCKQ